MKPTAVIFDADSTLFDTTQRHHLSPRSNPDNPEITWDTYADTCDQDDVFAGVVQVAKLLKDAGHLVFIVTARRGKWRDKTLAAVKRHRIPCDILYMLEDDYEESWHQDHQEFKRGILQHIIKSYKVVLAFEDWPHLAKMYEENGVPAVCVNPAYGADTADSYNNH